MVGRKTAQLDDPLLTSTARLDEGTESACYRGSDRIATRIVLDSMARLPSFSQLVRTAAAISDANRRRPGSPGKRAAPTGSRRLRSAAVRAAQPLRAADPTAR